MPREEPSNTVDAVLEELTSNKWDKKGILTVLINKICNLRHEYLHASGPPGVDRGHWKYGDAEPGDDWIEDREPGKPDVQAREEARVELQEIYPRLLEISSLLKAQHASCTRSQFLRKSEIMRTLLIANTTYKEIHSLFNPDKPENSSS